MGILSYEGDYPKPSREGFLEACRFFGFDPGATVMVGDNPNTDGGAVGVLEGVVFIKPIPENKKVLSASKKLIVPFQNALRRLGIFATTVANPQILRSKDMKISTTTAG